MNLSLLINHRFVSKILPVCLGLIFLILLAACSSLSGNQPRISITQPADGATVSNPVMIKMIAQNFAVEPAGEVKSGAGHLHIIVDSDCVPAGEVIVKDDMHLHYGQGQLEAELALTPGKHTLCLQAADGAHIALAGEGMTNVITVNVQ